MTTNFVEVNYQTSSISVNTNAMGMREMQERAFEARNSQYLLLKSPPASGKSRALMFIALDKMKYQNIKKTIIAVPEKSIAGSFLDTDLTTYGFYSDWQVKPENNLCIDASNTSVEFKRFLKSDDSVLVCTHSTLRNSANSLPASDFDGCLIAIDEFHHVSSNDESRLGSLLESIMDQSTAHVLAMTGTYFRGNSEAVLKSEYEVQFDKVTYNYYEQLSGYKHLKSLAIGYHLDELQNQITKTSRRVQIPLKKINRLI